MKTQMIWLKKLYTKDGTWKGKERLVLSVFDLNGKLIDDGNGDKRIITFAYDIRINPKHALTLKNILSKIAIKEAKHLKLFPMI